MTRHAHSRRRSLLSALGARTLAFALAAWTLCATARADDSLHFLWELHGKHNTVYLMGSIHVLRPGDYPLARTLEDAYRNSKALLMEINMDELDLGHAQAEMLSSAMLADGKTLPQVLGAARYSRAAELAGSVGFDLSTFDLFAPWFAAEAISQAQLAQLGFDPQSGVEMHFMGRARSDGKPVSGLETVHDQIAVFQGLSLDAQADYLIGSLEQAHDLPRDVNDMIHAWQQGDTRWFEAEVKSDIGRDPTLYQSLLVARNRKWISRIESLLNDDQNYLVIVGTGHLVGQGSVLDLLKKDGITATQR